MFSTGRVASIATVLFFFALVNQDVNAFKNHFMGRFVNGKTLRDHIFDKMMGIDSNKFVTKDESVCPDDQNKKLTIAYFDQPLDQFSNDTSKSPRWQQHYQVNDKFFDKNTSSPVVFLMIGGEGPISNKWVCYENYTYMQAAKNYSAKVIQLEHRFFGANKGLKDLSTDSLQWLTTEQALADINAFILGYNKMQNWTSPKWVAFGGSYPGTIAGLLRLKYPGITQGNVASSAPLRPVVDFWEYAYVMENTIKTTSQECYDAVKAAFKSLIDSTVSVGLRKKLNDQLNLSPKISTDNPKKEDLDTITSDVFGAFQGIIQYTYVGAFDAIENKTGSQQNIFHVCKVMTDPATTDPIDRLYKVYQIANGKGSNVQASYQNSINDLLKISLDPINTGRDMRGWMWLSCNEFGWLQSTSNAGLFGDAVPISLYIRMCSDLFDKTLNATQIQQKIKDTSDRYGSTDKYNGTNVFLPNGGFDPWSALGVQDNQTLTAARQSQHLITHLTPESAHCSDIPKGLAETRKIFFQEVNYYLSQDSVFKNGGNTGDGGGKKDDKKGNGSSATVVTNLMFPLVLAYFWVFN